MASENITLGSSSGDATEPQLVVRTVTVEHHKVNLKKHHTSHGGGGGNDNHAPTSVPPPVATSQLPASSPPVVIVTPESSTDDEKNPSKKRKRGGIGYYVCCGLLLLIALIAGLAGGLSGKTTDGNDTSSRIRLNLDLKFDVTGKEVNITLVSELRCLIANLTNPNLLDRILLTVWVESNGTVVFVDPEHPLNDANDCTVYVDNFGTARRRRLQYFNNSWLYPIDPISVNISAVPPKADDPDDISFVDAIYSSDEILAIAPLTAIAKEGYLIPPTPSRTGTPTPSVTPSISASSSASVTPSGTPTSTPTGTGTPSSSHTGTRTPSATPSVSASGSNSPSNSPSASNTPSNSPSSSNTPSPSPSNLPIYTKIDFLHTPRQWASGATQLYFNGRDDAFGDEIWVTKGTAASTVRCTDLAPGPARSYPSDLVAFTDDKGYEYIYFAGFNETYGFELYRTNCTNTELVADIETGTGDSYPSDMFLYNDQLIFSAETTALGGELYVMYKNGTVALIADIRSGSPSSYPQAFVICNGILYFHAQGPLGRELYSLDTSNTLTLVKDIFVGGSSNPANFQCIKNRLFFQATTASFGSEPFVYNGTDAYLLMDISAGSGNSNPSGFTYLSTVNKIFFKAGNTTFGTELYATDADNPVSSTTYLFKDIAPGSGSSSPDFLVLLNESWIIFRGTVGGDAEPYVTDGTPENTYRLANMNPSGSSTPAYYTPGLNNVTYFGATGNNTGSELFSTDGTNIQLVYDIVPGGASSNSAPTDFFFHNRTSNPFIVFSAYDGVRFRLVIIPKLG